MSVSNPAPDVSVTLNGQIATVEIHRPPHNYFDVALIRAIASAYHALDDEPAIRAIILVSEGRSFCAGAQLAGPAERAAADPESSPSRRPGSGHLYQEAIRLLEAETPVVAAVQGAAIGGGLGLALSADFRVAAPEARFSANFARLGFHHGFGLTVTLPALVGQQKALDLLYTGRRVRGEEAFDIGLCDALVPLDGLRDKANEMAAEIAGSAPLAVRSIRRTMRRDLAERVRIATDHELVEQDWLRQTNDFREGVQATSERRAPKFTGT
ncbi:MAG: enoyl-CoA hydratase [Dehalococcoidia bacterium]|nr:enoyl-CoA hydratase [Dehalococcoidia bacterium]|tara:strand:+ start:504 stop:1310 length:807 start_codon:yes stop_codon:yes gene_type:complete